MVILMLINIKKNYKLLFSLIVIIVAVGSLYFFNKSLNGEAFDFHLGRAKVNDRIQFYLNRVFLPLVHYINDFLIEEMLSLDE